MTSRTETAVRERVSSCQFHQLSRYSFYTRRSQKRKKILTTCLSFLCIWALLKSCALNVDEIEPWCQFINILQAAFARADPKRAKETDVLTVFLRFQDLSA